MNKIEKIVNSFLKESGYKGVEVFTVSRGSKKPPKSTFSKIVITKDENGGPAILVENYDAYSALVTSILLATNTYQIYKDAIENSLTTEESAKVVETSGINTQSGFLLPYGDLRLGVDGQLPGSGNGRFIVPEEVTAVESAIEKIIGEIFFTDEATICQKCHRIIAFHQSYGEADWIKVRTPEGDHHYYHTGCISERRALAACVYEGVHFRSQQRWLQEKIVGLPSQFGDKLAEIPITYEYGFHDHQDDDPHKIIMELSREHVAVWVRVAPSQFHVEFKFLVKPKDLTKAMRTLECTSFKTDYSPSKTMKAALRGQLPITEINQPSEDKNIRIQSINYLDQTTSVQFVSMEDFKNGRY